MRFGVAPGGHPASLVADHIGGYSPGRGRPREDRRCLTLFPRGGYMTASRNTREDLVLVRDTAGRAGPVLSVPAQAWQRFTDTLRSPGAA